MEQLEAETLAHRLEKAPSPLVEVLEFGRQIAEVLARSRSMSYTRSVASRATASRVEDRRGSVAGDAVPAVTLIAAHETLTNASYSSGAIGRNFCPRRARSQLSISSRPWRAAHSVTKPSTRGGRLPEEIPSVPMSMDARFPP